MKIFMVVILFILSGCGGDNEKKRVVTGASQIQAFNVADDSILYARYQTTKSCLDKYGIKNDVPPVVVIMSDRFLCSGLDAVGCAVISENAIYITQQTEYTAVFKHECVHIIMQIGNEGHGTLPFNDCEYF